MENPAFPDCNQCAVPDGHEDAISARKIQQEDESVKHEEPIGPSWNALIFGLPKFNSSFAQKESYKIPIGKACHRLPSTIFKARAVKFWGCNIQ